MKYLMNSDEIGVVIFCLMPILRAIDIESTEFWELEKSVWWVGSSDLVFGNKFGTSTSNGYTVLGCLLVGRVQNVVKNVLLI